MDRRLQKEKEGYEVDLGDLVIADVKVLMWKCTHREFIVLMDVQSTIQQQCCIFVLCDRKIM